MIVSLPLRPLGAALTIPAARSAPVPGLVDHPIAAPTGHPADRRSPWTARFTPVS